MVIPLTTISATSSRRAAVSAVVATGLWLAAAAPALAEHKARVDLALADHIRADSQSIDVILHDNCDALAARYNLRVKRYMRSGCVITMTAGQAAAVQADVDVDHLSIDVKYKSSVDPIDESIGADQVWAGAGNLPRLSGQGVTVAVVDSGIDSRHSALKTRVLLTVDFTGGDGVDRFGHGTHVAGIIAGEPGITADTQEYRGVASGAYLLNLRVLGNDGSGAASDVIEAIDWAIEHRREYNIRIINLSLGAPVMQPYRDDPVCEAVERAVRAGILVVAAAGNHGRTPAGQRVLGGITSPGNSPYAVTVGALDTKGTAERSDDEVAAFSSRGPTLFDLVLKPDLVAPGRRVTSAEAAGSLLSEMFPERHVAGIAANAYIQGSGTSMAAAVVSGAAALLLDERPNLRPSAIKAALQITSSFMPEAGIVGAGAGSLNVLAAAAFVQDGELRDTAIGGEPAGPGLIVIASADEIVMVQASYRWIASNDSLRKLLRRALEVPASSNSVVWVDSNSVVWGSANSVVWGSANSVVWGSANSVIWGSANSVVWGNANSVVWGSSDFDLWGL